MIRSLFLIIPFCIAAYAQDYQQPIKSNGQIDPTALRAVLDDVYQTLDVNKSSDTRTAEALYLKKSSATATYANYDTTEELYLRKSSSTATYATKNFMSSYAAKSNNTKYEALTDGVVSVLCLTGTATDRAVALIYIGSSADIDAGNYLTMGDQATYDSSVLYGGFSCPVNKGQFWKVTAILVNSGSVTTRWMSFGN